MTLLAAEVNQVNGPDPLNLSITDAPTNRASRSGAVLHLSPPDIGLSPTISQRFRSVISTT